MVEPNDLFVNMIREDAIELADLDGDLTPLLDRIGAARIVLIGEATHGSQEFYQTRANLTRRLIEEKGFNAVTVEADWPEAYRVNRFVQDRGEVGENSEEALAAFQSFPVWMWRNSVMRDFATWLRDFNRRLPAGRKVGFYGLDLYSLYSSMEAVVQYLEKVDPDAAKRARFRYACFEHFGEDPQTYGYAAGFDLTAKCEQEAVEQLRELSQRAFEYVRRDGFVAEDEYFYAQQNARVAMNAEEYYREMFRGEVSSWNLRDTHMVETLQALDEHLSRQGSPAKIVVWEHNSHLGDSRATEMYQRGEVNVGQLVRERYGDEAVNIGFTTYTGTVTAASDWGSPAERKTVRPGLVGSYEGLFHQVAMPRFMLIWENNRDAVNEYLSRTKLERAIGVVYLPKSERISHYFYAQLPQQFDAVIHIDETHALEPLERNSQWEHGEVPETYPTGQ